MIRKVSLSLFLLSAFSSFLLFGQGASLVIEGGSLVDIPAGKLVEVGAVIIEGGKFSRITTREEEVSYPPGARVISAAGKYLLPGLIDPHIHLRGWDLELYPAFGVTTVVDTGSPTDWILLQREGVEKGRMKGPRMFVSGNTLAGFPKDPNAFQKPHHTWLDSVDGARAAVKQHIAAGVNLIKLYPGLSKDMLKAIIAEAHAAGLPVVGHVNTAWEAVEVGQDAIFHMSEISPELVEDGFESNDAVQIDAHMDFKKADALISAMVSKGMYFDCVPRTTWEFAHKDKFQHEDFDLLFNNINLRYIPLNIRLAIVKEYNEVGLYWYQHLSEKQRQAAWQAYRNSMEFIGRFFRAGGKLLAGSDTLTTGGLSLHQALEVLVSGAKLSPAEALQTVTTNPATLYRFADKLGSVEAGKIADILILSANPLDNIRNTRSIEHVIKEGAIVDTSFDPEFANPIPRPDPERTSHLFTSPVVSRVSPRMVRQRDQDFEVTIKGSGFIPYSVAHFNGEPIATTFQDIFTLKARIPGRLLDRVGTYPVVVLNPEGPVGTITGAGQGGLAVLGARDEKSNEYMFMVGFKQD